MKTERKSAPLLAALITVLGGLLLPACNERPDQRCDCEGDCGDGLVCAVGNTMLGEGRCAADLLAESGTCVQPDDSLAEDPLVPPAHFDLGHWVTTSATDGGAITGTTSLGTTESGTTTAGTTTETTASTTSSTDGTTSTTASGTTSESTGTTGDASTSATSR